MLSIGRSLTYRGVGGAGLRVVSGPPTSSRRSAYSLIGSVLGSDRRRLKGLEEMAVKNPGNANAQLAFLRELGKKHPKAVVSWVDSSNFAINEGVAKEYLIAQSKLGRISTVNIGKLASVAGLTSETAERLAAHDTLQIPTLSGVEGSGASPASPLHVTLSNSGSGWKNQAWKTLRSVLIAFLGITALATLFESGSLGGKMGLPQTAQLAEESDKSFKDVVGVDEAKAELEEIVLYLRDPSRFTRLGGKLPKGLLLLGAPGTGKTLLARAIAGEAGVPFYYTSGSAFEEMFVGVGARRVRDLFNEAKKRAPCIVFIDEIDAIGGSRQLREQQNMKMTLNQLLVEMDGFEENNGVIVIAATNFPEGLDKALVRPGRFDKRVAVPLPDVKGRRQILTLYGSQVSLRDDVNLDQLARGTPGFSGADLCNIVNQAAVKASMDGLSFVTTSTLEWAKDKILMGSERKSALIDPKTKKCTAYHEGGHALIAVKSLSAEPVHKATILPRGNALGMVVQLPEGDQTSYTRVQLMAKLDVLMGGRVAEELLFGDMGYSTGPSNDLEQATKLARMMVSQWGMSDKLGLVSHKDSTETSEAYKRIVDEEIQKLVTESYERAKGIITTHRKDLDRLANALLEHETLTGEEVKMVVEGKEIVKDAEKLEEFQQQLQPRAPVRRKKGPVLIPDEGKVRLTPSG